MRSMHPVQDGGDNEKVETDVMNGEGRGRKRERGER